MNDYSNFRKEPDMIKYSGEFHVENQFLQEGQYFKVNGNESIFIDDREVKYYGIIRNTGVEHKEGLEVRLLDFKKELNIKQGDYITWGGYNWLIIPMIDHDNPFMDSTSMTLCNNSLNYAGLKHPIPCWCNNSSYGVKGVIETNYMGQIDGKILAYAQDCPETRAIHIDMRFIFDHDPNQVYKVIKTETVTTGRARQIVLTKDDYDAINDDLVNNIAYNSINNNKHNVIKENNYTIKSSINKFAIRKLSKTTFSVYNDDQLDGGIWDIIIDKGSLSDEDFEIVEKTKNSITIKNNLGYSDYVLNLKFSNGATVLDVPVQLVFK